MNQVEYDALIQDVTSTETGFLPGVSVTLQVTFGALKDLSTRWGQPAVTPVGGLLICPRWPSDVREKLIGRYVIPSWQRLDLQPQSPVYNSGLLFGDGTQIGVLEAPRAEGAIIVGIEHLTPELTERWIIHLRVWWHSRPAGTGRRPHLLHIAEDGSHPALCLQRSELLTVISLPPLNTRRQDIVYLVHAEAAACKGSLGDFESRAIDVLIEHEWPGDWFELRALVNQLYENSTPDAPCVFDGERVRRGLERMAGLFAPTLMAEPHTVWEILRSLAGQCDTLTQPLLGKPFFPDKSFDNSPLDCPNPQLRLSRLVSWGYMTFQDRDGAADTLEALIKLPLGNRGSPKDIKSLCDLFQNWRTLEQHVDERSKRGQQMRRRVADWCEKACCAASPGDPHWERCVVNLLLDLQRLFSLIIERLQALCEAAEPEMLAAQWRERLETTWPKYKHEQLLNRVLEDLGRTELSGTTIAQALLEPMQHQLTYYSPTSDRERHLRGWLEEEIQRRFPHPPLIGDDLVQLGVPPAHVEYWLRRCNRLHREQGKDRDDLLGLVASELRSAPRPKDSQLVPS
jgi:hypothetical protein